MDANRFDVITAHLATPLSRRRSAGLLALLGLGSLVADDAEARRRRKKKKKKNKKQGLRCGVGTRVCGRECIPASACCGSCPNGSFCKDGACTTCTAEETNCGNVCANLATDPNNCGKCGRSCPSGECLNGACTCHGEEVPCPTGCDCIPEAHGGGACGGGYTDKECDNYFCGVGEVCQALYVQCRAMC